MCQKLVPGGHLVFITSDEEAAAMLQVMNVPAGNYCTVLNSCERIGLVYLTFSFCQKRYLDGREN